MNDLSATILLCDEDRAHNAMLAAAFRALGYAVELTHGHAEAFAIACARDFHALVTAPFLRDGSALALPAALGIRRPLVIALASRLSERLTADIVVRAGFDAQLTKAVDAAQVHRLVCLRADELACRERSEAHDHEDLRRGPR